MSLSHQPGGGGGGGHEGGAERSGSEGILKLEGGRRFLLEAESSSDEDNKGAREGGVGATFKGRALLRSRVAAGMHQISPKPMAAQGEIKG